MPLKGLKIEFELHKQLRKAAADKGVTIQQIAESSLTEYLGRLSGKAPAEPDAQDQNSSHITSGTSAIASTSGTIPHIGKIADGEIQWINRLLRILRSERIILSEAIQKNLAAFCLICGELDERSDLGHVVPPGHLNAGTRRLIATAKGVGRRAKGTIGDPSRSKGGGKRDGEKAG